MCNYLRWGGDVLSRAAQTVPPVHTTDFKGVIMIDSIATLFTTFVDLISGGISGFVDAIASFLR